ncbi:hypothetical protein [Nocardia pneumoniae]|uniref:hypothetical protein n=1 Tax=Nocardia pneumoniae TaxID=228601 RepID=UPI00030C3BAE|nr:hypothetical protein [Nocardia pneumoniae]
MTVNPTPEELGRCPVAHGQQPASWSTRYAARLGMGQRRRPPGVPVYDEDIYSVAVIRDPYTHYRAMRALGPVVWLQNGTHGCAGQGLSRMETEAILGALLRYVDRIELTGTPEVAVNNVIHRFETLPLRLVGRRDQ